MISEYNYAIVHIQNPPLRSVAAICRNRPNYGRLKNLQTDKSGGLHLPSQCDIIIYVELTFDNIRAGYRCKQGVTGR